MSPADIVQILGIVSVVVLPAWAITARFALKPIVEAILRLKEGGLLGSPSSLGSQIEQLRAEVAELHHEVAQLREAEEFHHALTSPEVPRVTHLPAGL